MENLPTGQLLEEDSTYLDFTKEKRKVTVQINPVGSVHEAVWYSHDMMILSKEFTILEATHGITVERNLHGGLSPRRSCPGFESRPRRPLLHVFPLSPSYFLYAYYE
ncbi:hypothetical protein CHARACLAT_011655 [Characodon lateralis]|uniref:Uncharacterized protein n=1 Tax=Characodon lateralis TaxID=208331 RepID=A0ABU7DS35_9TELE|nr:hypothetical protein [Characodon lateralis]